MVYQTLANVKFGCHLSAIERDQFVCSKNIELFNVIIDVANKHDVWLEKLQIRTMYEDYEYGHNPYSTYEDEDLDFPLDLDPYALGVTIDITQDNRWCTRLYSREEHEQEAFFDDINTEVAKIVPMYFCETIYPRVDVSFHC